MANLNGMFGHRNQPTNSSVAPTTGGSMFGGLTGAFGDPWSRLGIIKRPPATPASTSTTSQSTGTNSASSSTASTSSTTPSTSTSTSSSTSQSQGQSTSSTGTGSSGTTAASSGRLFAEFHVERSEAEEAAAALANRSSEQAAAEQAAIENRAKLRQLIDAEQQARVKEEEKEKVSTTTTTATTVVTNNSSNATKKELTKTNCKIEYGHGARKLNIDDIHYMVNFNKIESIEGDDWSVLVESESPDVIAWKRAERDGLIRVKACAHIVGHSPAAIFKLIFIHEYANKWGDAWKSQESVERLDNLNEVLYMVANVPFGVSYRDFVVFRADWHSEDYKTWVIAFRNGSHPKCPEKYGHVRGETLGCFGYLIKALDKPNHKGERVCEVHVTSCFDLKGYIPKSVVNWAMTRYPINWSNKLQMVCDRWDVWKAKKMTDVEIYKTDFGPDITERV
jgi:hypothetical protein